MRRVVIADTSFLIAIQKMQLFNVIHTFYQEVYVTKTIAEEFQQDLPDWIIIQTPVNLQIQSALSFTMDPGEASAIALAYDYEDVIIIIDDLKARKEAVRLGFKITGTLGVLFRLKEKGLIHSLREKISELIDFGFRISPKIIEEMLRNAGEE